MPGDEADDAHLSRIETLWSVVAQAHRRDESAFAGAQRQLLDRYGGAVRRYATAVLRDSDAADEVFQEFALKFVRGDFGRATPEKGRFRSFLKSALYHLIVDFQRRKNRQAKHAPLLSHQAEQLDAAQPDDDAAFVASWRDELLSRVWGAIADYEARTGKAFHTVLRVRVAHPAVRSPELAELVAAELNKPMTAGAVRVLLHRAREQFGELLLDEVAQSLDNADPDQLQEELIELDLWQYCREIVERRRQTAD
jgi:RNA polymerase sigma-70 factor (ECF subfamily)